MIGALFDFDGTLYTGHIWQDLAHHDWAAKRQRRWLAWYVMRNMAFWPLYKLKMMSQVAFYGGWGETMSWLIRGWTVEEAQALFDQLVDEQIMPNLRPEILSRLERHRNQGHFIALVSGTFAPCLDTVARRLGYPHAVGTPLEVHQGRYTGRIQQPLCQGAGKMQRVQSYLLEKGYAIEWAKSYAYADSGTDLHLMSQVGHPVAVYPDRTLLAHAQAKGWQLIGEEEG